MEKTSFKKIFLIICIIMTLLAPSICADIVYAMDEDVQDEVQEDVAQDEDLQNTEEENGEENINEGELQDSENPIIEDNDLDVPQPIAEELHNENLNDGIVTIASDIFVEPGTGTLQKAINQAENGAVLQLKKGKYDDNSGQIVIDKPITIKGAGTGTTTGTAITPEIVIKDTTAENKVKIENITKWVTPLKYGYTHFDVQSPVDLEIKDIYILQIYNGDTNSINAKVFKLSEGSNGSKVKIDNANCDTVAETINIHSSNNTIDIVNKSEIDGKLALKLDSGSGNTLNITNSKLTGRSKWAVSDEAISIADQQDLTINITDSEIIGNDATGDRDTHVFSFDGERASTDVKINIKGNSVINDIKPIKGSTIFNFGASNTVNNSNVITVENTVTITPNTVAYKYNTDEDYSVVGVYDPDGKLKIKAYEKNAPVGDLDSYITDGNEYDWYKITDKTEKYEETENATENMDLKPILKESAKTVKVKIAGDNQEYDLDLGKTYKDNQELSAKIKELGEVQGKTLARLVDEEGQTIEETTPIVKDTTITPKYNITITVQDKDQGNKTYQLEEGKNLSYIEELVEKYEKPELYNYKQFNRYIDPATGKKVSKSDPITTDTTISPQYCVKVIVEVSAGNQFTYTIDEGTSLTNGLINTYLIQIKNAIKAQNKEFLYFTDSNDGTTKGYTDDIYKNTTLTAKYTVKVTIGEEEFTLEEGQSLENIKPEDEERFAATKVKGERPFSRFVDEEGNTFEESTQIDKNITLTPEFKINVKINGKDYQIEEGQTLGDLEQEGQEVLEALKEADGKEFAGYVDGGGNSIDITDSIYDNTEIKATFNVHVTIGNEVFTIKEGETLENIKPEDEDRFAATKVKTGKTFAKFVDENGEEVKETDSIEKHTKLTPIFNIKVTINGTDYDLEDGKTLKDLPQAAQETLQALKEASNKTWTGFVDENGTTIEETTPITKNTTVTAKYTVKVTIGGEDYTLEEGQTLDNLTPEGKQALQALKTTPGKNFAGYEANGKPIEMDTPLNENAEITAKYGVRVTIGEDEFDIEENQTLNNSTPEVKAVLDALRNVKGKQFVKFVDGEGNTIDPDQSLTTNITVIAKYNVTVKVGENSYTLEEGQKLEDLPSEAQAAIEALKDVEDKTFEKYEYVDEDGNVVELQPTEEIHFNITVKAKYNVKVEISKEDGTSESFVLAEGQTLNDLSDENKAKLQAIKDNHAEGWRFAKFVNAETGEEIGENTPITEDIVIKPVYEEIPAEEAETTPNEDNNGIVNPKTSDNILNFVALGLIGLACIVISIIAYRRKNK